jgi:hypothetical protein
MNINNLSLIQMHQQKLNTILKNIKSSDKKISTIRKKYISKTLREKKYKNKCFNIDLSDFDNILELTNEYIYFEPNVTMEQMVNFLSRKDLSLNVITEFKTMSIGGAISGLGAESSSFKYGLIHNNVIEYEIINEFGNIEIVDKNHKLFNLIPGSYGSICIITAIKSKIFKIKPYVRLKFIRKKNINAKDLYDNSCDFIEGVMLNKNHYVIIKGYYTKEKSTYNLKNRFSRLFFDFVINKKYKSMTLSYYDYIFRWDRGAFWVAYNKKINYIKQIIYSNLLGLIDFSFQDKLSAENLYKYARSKHPIFRESNSMYQDIIIPSKNFENFKKFIDNTLKIYPIWLLPINSTIKINQAFALKKNRKYINFGIYGSIKHLGFDFIKINRDVEKKTFELNGIKTLYNQSYYDMSQFYKIYLHYPTNKFIDLYSKTCELYNSFKKKYPTIKMLINKKIIHNRESYNRYLYDYILKNDK